MEFGVCYLPRAVEDVLEKARVAEEGGFDFMGLGDSQSVFRELYTTLSIAAHETDRIRLGPTITNPVTRHPAVTASAVGTLGEHEPGRIFLGIGSGDSAVYTLGKRPARLADTRETIETIDALLGEQATDYEGAEIALRWLQETDETLDVPIYLAAEGPRTLRLAGQVADGVILGGGHDQQFLRESIDRVHDGAAEAGRDPGDVTCWVFAQGSIAETREAAVDHIKMSLAANAHHSLQFSMEKKGVPEEYTRPLRELVENYDSDEHEVQGATTNRALVESLDPDVVDYLVERYAVAGTPDDCIEKLQFLAETPGVDGVLLTTHAEERQGLIDRMGSEVLPSF